MNKKSFSKAAYRRPRPGDSSGLTLLLFPGLLLVATVSTLISQGAFDRPEPPRQLTEEQMQAFYQTVKHHALLNTFNRYYSRGNIERQLEQADFNAQEISLYETCRKKSETMYRDHAYPAWAQSEYTLNCMQTKTL